jgi:glycosyltransferase involved in cell wall biosynthesis
LEARVISLVIPVYNNSGNVPPLLAALSRLSRALPLPLEVIFVVDGSPDDSHAQLHRALPSAEFPSKLLLLSRNFGSFAAIRAGLEAGNGDYFAVIAADLQEPPNLIEQFLDRMLSGKAQVVVGKRIGRDDPRLTRLLSGTFWWLYRRLVQPAIPEGGVDIFACTREVRDQILRLDEQNSSLVGLLYWVGFRREEVPYHRRARQIGRSSWTLRKKCRYLSDSVFSFTDLPIRALTLVGLVGFIFTSCLGTVVIACRLLGVIDLPGYAATVLIIMFFGTLNCFGLGLIGGYVWRAFENSKGRPGYIVAATETYPGISGFAEIGWTKSSGEEKVA